MGAGSRFEIGKAGKSDAFRIGVFYNKFPFNHTFTFCIVWWFISIGLGKPQHD